MESLSGLKIPRHSKPVAWRTGSSDWQGPLTKNVRQKQHALPAGLLGWGAAMEHSGTFVCDALCYGGHEAARIRYSVWRIRITKFVRGKDRCGIHSLRVCNIFFCVHQVHHDPQLFPNPEKFDPTRFLNENGEYQSNPHVIPFSVGKRVCLGESLARMELFIFWTGLMQKYRVKLPDEFLNDQSKMSIAAEGTDGLIHCVGPHEIIFTQR